MPRIVITLRSTSPTQFDETGDILVPLLEEQFMEYIDVCKIRLPKSLRAHNFLLMQHRWRTFLRQPENQQIKAKISPLCLFNIFVPRNGDVNNCTFFGISNQHPELKTLTVFPHTFQETCKELEECIRQTKLIKWNCSPLLLSVPLNYNNFFKKFWAENKYEVAFDEPSTSMRLPRESALSFECALPDNIYQAPLTEEHVPAIYEVWPEKHLLPPEWLKTQILLNGGLGLFDAASKQLLSWVITNENLAIGSVQTHESAQRKGLAKLLMKIYCKKYAETESLDVLAFVVEDNVPSQKLFKGLGFIECETNSWIRLK